MDNDSISEKLQVRFGELLEQNGKKILQWSLIALFAIVAIIYFFLIKDDKKSLSAPLDAAYYSLAHSSKEEIPHEMKSFESALKANPSLIPNYQGKAAQTLIEKSAVAEAAPLIFPLFQRVHLETFPEFKEYSEITIAIAEGDLQAALEKSKALQKTIVNQELLAAHNIVRIAFLQKLIDDPEFNQTAETIRVLLTGTDPISESLRQVDKIYSYKTLGLLQFLEISLQE